MIKTSYTDIKKVAKLLDTGFLVYIHKQTGKIVAIPEFDDFMDFGDDDSELLMAEVENHPEKYLHIKKMTSREVFNTMMDFAQEQEEMETTHKLVEELRKSNPISNFNNSIRYMGPQIRKAWIDYRDDRTNNHIRNRLWSARKMH